MSTSAGCMPHNHEGIFVRELSFDRIPGQSALFRDIQNGEASAAQFYPAANDLADLISNSSVVLQNYKTDRRLLVDELSRQNEEFGSSAATLANLDKLVDPDTVAIITGQQAGLFTGPVYTIYKALSVIKIAAELDRRGQKAVPIFWIASEDHDIDEVSWAGTSDGHGNVRRVDLDINESIRGLPVGKIPLSSGIGRAIEELISSIDNTPNRDAVASELREIWKSDVTFATAFGRSLSRLLGDRGLIIVDPMSDVLRQMSSSTFADAIERSDEIIASVIEQNEKLIQSGYHTQVEIDSSYFPLFRFDDVGKRRTIRKIGDDEFREKDGDRRFTRTELSTEARSEPTRFSPGVLLRPVIQDVLFPTACYIGGAAEVSYFAQNAGVYRALDRPRTPVMHRSSISLIGGRHQKQLDKLGITFEDLFSPADELRQRLTELGSDRDLANLFAGVEERINGELNRLDQRLADFDVTLAASLARRRQRMIYHIAELRRKSLIESGRRSDLLGDRLDALYSEILPNGGLQERYINIYPLIARFGSDLIEQIYGAIDISSKGHLVFNLER